MFIIARAVPAMLTTSRGSHSVMTTLSRKASRFMDPNVDVVPGGRQGGGSLPLFERFPRLESFAPRVRLARLPTPVERLPVDGTNAWIKRDDLTGTVYGGNKVRKLEFLLAAAGSAGAGRLVTVGAIGSHHALATTIYGVAAGFDVTAVLMPQPPTGHVRGVLRAMAAHGAELRIVRGPATVPAGIAAARLAHLRERVRTIPAGGSDAIGTLGYVNAALELERQREEGLCPAFAEAHVAGGTLGTAVGLAVGLAIAGAPTRVIAHRITSRAITNDRRAKRLVRRTLALLGRAARATGELPSTSDVLARLRIDHSQIGRGYGHATPAASDAAAWFAEHAGLELDLTYTAKAAAGFLAAARRQPVGPIVYWHTLSSADEAVDTAHLDLEGFAPSIRRFL
jgi:1-aminocyclopropane-1-carboxylate deaminase/D-cysteine desulfhydrase-like pyridoxal-dependent ACC family enzyme